MPILCLLIVLAKLIVFPFLLTASKKGNIFNGVKQENAGFVFDKFVFSQVIFLGISFLKFCSITVFAFIWYSVFIVLLSLL